MTSENIVGQVISALEASAIPYMVVGSISSNFYGVPRSTQDADFVIQFDGAETIHKLAQSLGPDFKIDDQMSFETTTSTMRHEASVRNSPFRIEFFHLGDDPHDRVRFERRVRVNLGTSETWLPSVEDVIITKLRWARPKDREDLCAIIGVQGDAIHWPFVYSWCDQHGTRKLLDEIRGSLPFL